jgi:phosphoenolpyruvate carboxylase
MFERSRLFRLIVDEVEKTLSYVDLEIARLYAELCPDPAVRDTIFACIEAEYRRTVRMILAVSGGGELAERFPRFRRRLARRLATINQVSRQQVELLRRFRLAQREEERQQFLAALLLSINCISTGFGARGGGGGCLGAAMADAQRLPPAVAGQDGLSWAARRGEG